MRDRVENDLARFPVRFVGRSVKEIVPIWTSGRLSGQLLVASVTSSPGSANCTKRWNLTGPCAIRIENSSWRKSGCFFAASSSVRYSVPASGRMR